MALARSATRAVPRVGAAEMTIEPLGIIPEERLTFVPRDIVPRHEFCFWLHDQAARLLVEASQSGQIEDWHEAVSSALSMLDENIDESKILSALAESGGALCVPMKVDIFVAVLSDTLHFIYEALKALEKRKFNVAFSLLRKPLTENLIILSRLVANDDHFIRSFADGTFQQKQVMQIDRSERINLFNSVIDKLPVGSPFTGELIDDIAFSKDAPNGLQIRMQQSMHLVTTRHPALLTPKLGMNRIFFDEQGDENYSAYDSLPTIILFILQMSISKLSTYLATDERSTNEIMVRALGIFSNLHPGKLDGMSQYLNRTLVDFFKCEWCEKGDAKIRKKHVAKFYLHDQIHCTRCNHQSHTPFTYILRSGHLKIVESERIPDSEYVKLFG
ncbi:hypothetical protein FVA81_24465 [Rhizobium sp. WL3]|uniref:hypothetical protein n=1 Tax=Rhizobium sp. WL3 TaxID=2603277 RepID=UPI0011C1F8FC|nr:hypothetical protein [Rhizobium sp. WL3]QEE47567.1 hypothetical protein FVA81_24465 [Rhizobium sp. WL3]